VAGNSSGSEAGRNLEAALRRKPQVAWGERMILVAGATGNVGRQVVGALAANGADVRALSRLSLPRPVGEGRSRVAAWLAT
jgi:hypothetical protein